MALAPIAAWSKLKTTPPPSATLGYEKHKGVKINLPQHGYGTIHIDGVEINNVRGFRVSSEAGDVNILSLDIIANEVEIDGVFDVEKKRIALE